MLRTFSLVISVPVTSEVSAQQTHAGEAFKATRADAWRYVSCPSRIQFRPRSGNPTTSSLTSALRASNAFRSGNVKLEKHNKPLVPTRNGEAPLLAAQRRR